MHPYIGSGPYCYSNSLAMLLGADAPPVGVIETLTGAPFGAQVEGERPYFDPVGWHPEIGLDAAIDLLGWRCARTNGGSAAEAVDRLRVALDHGPVLLGPLDMGLLSYRPGSGVAIGADHYVVALVMEADVVVLHDPQGHPYATLPVADLAAAWRADEIAYADAPFVMRSEFVRARVVSVDEALEAAMPRAVRWLTGAPESTERIAELVDAGLTPDARDLLGVFGIRLGARRLADAATSLSRVGRHRAAHIAAEQSRVIGGLQHPLITGNDTELATQLRRLAPGYEHLRSALSG
ncbi:Butirosin biosynthesis protein H, N-terminal [Nocardia amikacinitolerans]|uniref:hypothetical protein n=1 Tax=Nocardia amikacinitolerans TaxID=756689 RepID=UPI000830DB42|nr:hypothetical protein [Nocardia amikacinitolerans]MCP2319161.1 Butirosin biosynthesis protein H, N-terminal [Nocardia amikacinitolerans]